MDTVFVLKKLKDVQGDWVLCLDHNLFWRVFSGQKNYRVDMSEVRIDLGWGVTTSTDATSTNAKIKKQNFK